MTNQQQVDIDEKQKSAEPSFGPPGMGSVEKPNDFKNTMKKLAIYCKGFI